MELSVKNLDEEQIAEAAALPPSLREAFVYWQERCSNDAPPSWRSLELHKMKAEHVHAAVMVEKVNEGEDFVYRYWGALRSAVFQCDLTGTLVSNYVRPELVPKLMYEYRRVLETKKPLLFSTTLAFNHGDRSPDPSERSYRKLRLPIRSAEDDINRVINFEALEERMDWRVVVRPDHVMFGPQKPQPGVLTDI